MFILILSFLISIYWWCKWLKIVMCSFQSFLFVCISYVCHVYGQEVINAISDCWLQGCHGHEKSWILGTSAEKSLKGLETLETQSVNVLKYDSSMLATLVVSRTYSFGVVTFAAIRPCVAHSQTIVRWVIRPVKTVGHITYIVLVQT